MHIYDSSHKDLPPKEGMWCKDRTGCGKCSRNVFPTFAMERESGLETYPELALIMFNTLKKALSRTNLHFMGLIEMVHCTIANLPCSKIGRASNKAG